MFKANNKEVRTTLTVSLFLNLSSTLNILKILHDVKMPKYVPYTGTMKEK